ncbi:bifunctional 2-polyprenyl-6-hydroxyphenol methylase/3-demethylubiquinol 3-O-methyltransferase UbiG [Aquabacterium sp.]|uniref:class I SAM-dependent methyltransferase n=1 Tax=Aquabacterium sp. TaxID=1872578 RepID=UPI0025BA9ACF|nr:class I SAM-dependent methyltransferase [Aquabacterium sp.]
MRDKANFRQSNEMREKVNAMREFWNQKFGDTTYKYGMQPNVFLREQAGLIPKGSRVLVPGDGEGRNGVWLAEQGHVVTSVDCSDVGLAKARKLAAQRSVRLETLDKDLTEWTPAAASVDAVVLVYLHLPSSQRSGIHAAMLQALKPGGHLILEAFHPTQIGLSSGGPKDADMLYTVAYLRRDAEASGVVGQELTGLEGRVTLDEGPFHQGPAQVTRWVWRRAV